MQAKGGPRLLVYEEAPDPTLESDDALVPVLAAGTTPTELTWQETFEIREGASGTHGHDMGQAIQAGISLMHINTEIRVGWRRGIEAALAKHPDEVARYKILPGAFEAVKEIVSARLKLFNSQASRSAGT